jgi:hypothetical protein
LVGEDKGEDGWMDDGVDGVDGFSGVSGDWMDCVEVCLEEIEEGRG